MSHNSCVENYRPVRHPRCRIFCFPYAGGSAATFYHWREALSTDVDLWTIEYPGHGRRRSELPLADISTLVTALIPDITPHLVGSFAVFGHSMGALVAFELLRRLRNVGGPHPLSFIVSGCRAPALAPRGKCSYDLPDCEFIEELRSLNGTPDEVLGDRELLRLILPVLRADFKASQTYGYQMGRRLQCPIVAYGGVADPEVTSTDLEPWRNETSASFVQRMFPGDHFFIHTSAQLLVRTINMDLVKSLAYGVPSL